jgi:hypothetical protein
MTRRGERTVLRGRPDAILAELLMDAPHGRGTVSERLKADGMTIPCYNVSTAPEALMGSIGLHELGVSGVFLKPFDTGIVIQTLKGRLGMGDRSA